MTTETHEGEYFTGVRPSFEAVIHDEVVYRASTKREAELALREALELHHPAYPSPGLGLED